MFGIEKSSSSFRRWNPQLCLYCYRKAGKGPLLGHKAKGHLLACIQTSWGYSLCSRFDWGRGMAVAGQTGSYNKLPVMLCRHTGVCLVSNLLPWYRCTWRIYGTFTFSEFTMLSFRERQIGNCGTVASLSSQLRAETTCERAEYCPLLPHITSLPCLHILTCLSFSPPWSFCRFSQLTLPKSLP